MTQQLKIYVAGRRGLDGSAIMRTHPELDSTKQAVAQASF